MPLLPVENLNFSFPNIAWEASKYDDWIFYRNYFQGICEGTKAVDLLALNNKVLWLIEVKDYRMHTRTKTIDLADEIACKVRNTLSGLFAASINANSPDEKNFAKQCIASKKLRVILHLEQVSHPSKLFPHLDVTKIEQKLKQKIKSIDPHPKIVSIANMRSLSWSVA